MSSKQYREGGEGYRVGGEVEEYRVWGKGYRARGEG